MNNKEKYKEVLEHIKEYLEDRDQGISNMLDKQLIKKNDEYKIGMETEDLYITLTFIKKV